MHMYTFQVKMSVQKVKEKTHHQSYLTVNLHSYNNDWLGKICNNGMDTMEVTSQFLA